MGDWFQTIADVEVSISEAEETASRILDGLIQLKIIDKTPQHCVLGNGFGYPPLQCGQVLEQPSLAYALHGLKVNGLEVNIGRRVFHNAQSGVTVTCAKCNTLATEKWSDAVSEWYEEQGSALLECGNCRNVQPITEWIFTPAWGFGNLGFTFWNWPPIKKSFVDEFAQRLGHRTVFIRDKC